jgi:hypothetical protein
MSAGYRNLDPKMIDALKRAIPYLASREQRISGGRRFPADIAQEGAQILHALLTAGEHAAVIDGHTVTIRLEIADIVFEQINRWGADADAASTSEALRLEAAP